MWLSVLPPGDYIRHEITPEIQGTNTTLEMLGMIVCSPITWFVNLAYYKYGIDTLEISIDLCITLDGRGRTCR